MTRSALFACAVPALALSALLGGCDKEPATGVAAPAGQEVLPGSVSDAMIDLDRSRAEAPRMPPMPDADRRPARVGAAEASTAPSEASPADGDTAAAAISPASPAAAGVLPGPTAAARPSPRPAPTE